MQLQCIMSFSLILTNRTHIENIDCKLESVLIPDFFRNTTCNIKNILENILSLTDNLHHNKAYRYVL